MNIADALYEFARTEIIPMIAGESQFTAGLLNGVLRASRKKITVQVADNSMLKAIGLVQDNGEIDQETLKDFFDGVFENNDVLPISLADILKAATGISSDNELLQDKLKITRADADKLMNLLAR